MAIPGSFDTRRCEDAIKRSIESQVGVTVSVKCPASVVQAKGTVFYCELVAEGVKPAKVKVVQQDDEGHYRWEIAQ